MTGVVDLLAAPAIRRPTFVAADLRGLAVPAATLALAALAGAQPTDDGLARLRAACRRAWAAADAGERRSSRRR